MGNFYPRSPCGERLRPIDVPQYQILISIHALLAESDETFIVLPKELYNFYPRSPCGERHILCVVSVQIGGFLSTLSLRRATNINNSVSTADKISIHALLAESDSSTNFLNISKLISIHALLAESDERADSLAHAPPQISIHALLAESDERSQDKRGQIQISIHALLAESDYTTTITICTVWIFLSTLSLRRATL